MMLKIRRSYLYLSLLIISLLAISCGGSLPISTQMVNEPAVNAQAVTQTPKTVETASQNTFVIFGAVY